MSQRAFRNALLDPEAAVPAGLTDPEGRPAGRRFDVYRNNVAASLTRALEAGFPVVRKIVGEEFFAAMAGVYLRKHPPASRLIMLYGDKMPQFLLEFPPVAHLPYLPDVARLELARRESYHAADAVPSDALASLSPEALLASRITLAPSLRLIRSAWPVHSIWSMNTSGTISPLPAHGEAALILRPEFDPVTHLIPDAAADFVLGLVAGQKVSEAADQAGETLDLGAVLLLLLQNRAIAGVF